MLARRGRLLWLLVLGACAGMDPAHRASTRRPAPERTAPPSDAALVAACDDLAQFRTVALAGAPAEERPALERWAPPRPVPDPDRVAVTRLVRRWVRHCARAEVTALASALIAFPTVAADEPPAEGAAFRGMAEFLERWATAAGLGFRKVGANDAWEVTLGSGPRSVGFVMHADVVPAAEPRPEHETEGTAPATSAPEGLPAGWSVPPFEGTVRDGKLWGRGAEDDKGPIAAVLVVMKLLASAGLTPPGQIVAILGTAEEHQWDGMRRYAETEPHARFTVSLDASFPVVVAESGFVAVRIGAPLGRARRRGTQARAVDARGGHFLTQVPGEARLVVEPAPSESVDALLARAERAAAAEAARRGSFSAEARRDGDRVVVRTTGVAVHSSQADQGHNALWALSSVAAQLDLEPGGINDVLRLVREKLDGDHWGERLGLAYEHPVMGRLLVTPTLLRVEEGRAVLGINMRRPAGLSSTEFGERLDRALATVRRDVSARLQEVGERYVGEPHLADTSGPLVETLLDVYRTHTGQTDAGTIAIRGGTYARLFPGAVSFGPELPGHTYRGHAPDEWIELETLDLYSRMILDAALRLSGAP